MADVDRPVYDPIEILHFPFSLQGHSVSRAIVKGELNDPNVAPAYYCCKTFTSRLMRSSNPLSATSSSYLTCNRSQTAALVPK